MSQNVTQCHLTRVEDASEGISDRQHAAMELILGGMSDAKVAETIGMARRTVIRWRMEHGPFRTMLEQRRRILHEQSADRLRALLTAALDTLEKQVSSAYAPTAIHAARTLLMVARVGKIAAAPSETHLQLEMKRQLREATNLPHAQTDNAPEPGESLEDNKNHG